MFSPGPGPPFEEPYFYHPYGWGYISAARGLPSPHRASPQVPVSQPYICLPNTWSLMIKETMAASSMYYLCLTMWTGYTCSVQGTRKGGKTEPSREAEKFQSKTELYRTPSPTPRLPASACTPLTTQNHPFVVLPYYQ